MMRTAGCLSLVSSVAQNQIIARVTLLFRPTMGTSTLPFLMELRLLHHELSGFRVNVFGNEGLAGQGPPVLYIIIQPGAVKPSPRISTQRVKGSEKQILFVRHLVVAEEALAREASACQKPCSGLRALISGFQCRRHFMFRAPLASENPPLHVTRRFVRLMMPTPAQRANCDPDFALALYSGDHGRSTCYCFAQGCVSSPPRWWLRSYGSRGRIARSWRTTIYWHRRH